MERRRLGRTGHLSTVVTLGCAAVGRVDQEAADRAIQTALDYGVNQIDVAHRCGEAELRLRPWMPLIRDQIFLNNCKTRERTREGAWADLDRSLERLGADHLDLYQFHAVNKMDLLDACTAKGGAVEALIAARDQGIVRWLGITGHTHDAPRVHLEALRRVDDLATVMFPLNFVLWSIPEYRRDAEALLEACRERDIGVQIIKTAAKGPWGDRPRTHTTWYEPLTDPEVIEQAVAFNLSLPVTTLCSTGDVTILPTFLAAAERYRPLDPAVQKALVAIGDRYQTPFVDEWA